MTRICLAPGKGIYPVVILELGGDHLYVEIVN